MDKRLRLTQVVIALLCVSLVFSLFAFGLVGGGASPDQQPPTVRPTSQAPRKVDEGQRLPGELARPLDRLDVFKPDVTPNPDRQTDYQAAGKPNVTLPGSLGDDLRAYAEQPVEWETCGEGLCAKVLAPLDWENPGQAAVELAVTKVPSANPSLDPLFVNPGGPGAGGTAFASQFAPDYFKGMDIIGWDPRGTGESTHVQCGSLAETDKLFDLDSTPDDASEERALQDGYRQFAKQCRDASGELLDHISSVDVARDMDLLRHLVGAEKLNFLGVSYGTFIGAMYATLFPDTSGRLVLDGAVEITDEEPVPQIVGFERAFVAWADWCAEQQVCVLHGKSSKELQQQVTNWLQSLDASPLDVGNRKLTQSHAATGIAMFLYADDSGYRALAEFLREAMAGNGEGLLRAADELNGRGQGGKYQTLAYAFPAMGCADSYDEGAAAVPKRAKEAMADTPILGRHMGYGYQCEFWTAEPLPAYKLDAKDADPILVVGSTGDSATPYEQAERMAKQLEPARLLTYEGAGHGAVTGGNQCVTRTVGEFLAEGTLPEEGKRCK